MPRKPAKPKVKARPQFDAATVLDDEDEEGACPIPDEDGNIVLRRSHPPAKKGASRGKGTAKKPRR